jgi:hypothetical protein
MSTAREKRLTKVVDRGLRIFWVIFVGLAIVWPIVAIGVGSGLLFDSELRYVEVFLGFKIFPDASVGLAADSTGTLHEIIRGKNKVQVNTSSLFAWHLAAVFAELSLFIFLYGLYQLRSLFASLVKDMSFTEENAVRIKRVGLVLIGWQIFAPFMQYISGQIMLNEIGLAIQGVQLYPALEINVAGLFVGLAVMVLSGVLREAAGMHEEQSLTI